ncbi:hypothetical protein J2783_003109 [Chryseobacterium sediminis]|nr:hypothetical protein [Chryseobacterium sediminis]
MEKTEKQTRHESLVEFLSNFSQYKSERKPRFKKTERLNNTFKTM